MTIEASADQPNGLPGGKADTTINSDDTPISEGVHVVPPVLLPHLNHSLDELRGKVGDITLEVLTEHFAATQTEPAAFFAGLAEGYLVGGQSLNQLYKLYRARGLDLSAPTFNKIIRNLEIPIINRIEAARKARLRMATAANTDLLRASNPFIDIATGTPILEGLQESPYYHLRIAAVKRGEIKRMGPALLQRLIDFEAHLISSGFQGGLPLWLSQSNRSLRDLEKEIEVSHGPLGRVFDYFHIPRPTHAEASRAVLAKLREDSEYVRKMADIHSKRLKQKHSDPEFEAKRIQALRASLKNPQHKKNRSDGGKKAWADNKTRRRNQSERSRKLMQAIWNDPKRRAKQVDRMGSIISGERRDLAFHTQSMWEANFARILKHIGRDFYTRENFTLEVSDKYRDLFNTQEVLFSMDFVTTHSNGHIILYEFLAHPRQDPLRYAKIDMLRTKYPNLKIHTVNEKSYRRFRRYFQAKINSDPQLCGWETSEDNLYNNPKKYS